MKLPKTQAEASNASNRAFANYRYQEDLFPTGRFRMAYDALRKATPSRSSKEYLKILKLAAEAGWQKKWPLPEPLGSALVSAARFQESTTRKVYVQALLIYSDLVIHGEVPD
jgi:hypothetical protein